MRLITHYFILLTVKINKIQCDLYARQTCRQGMCGKWQIMGIPVADASAKNVNKKINKFSKKCEINHKLIYSIDK